MKPRIDWKRLWAEFELWFGKTPFMEHPEWDEQQAKIQKLVEKQLKASK